MKYAAKNAVQRGIPHNNSTWKGGTPQCFQRMGRYLVRGVKGSSSRGKARSHGIIPQSLAKVKLPSRHNTTFEHLDATHPQRAFSDLCGMLFGILTDSALWAYRLNQAMAILGDDGKNLGKG